MFTRAVIHRISFAGGQAPEVFGQVFNALKQQAQAESS
jgi:hypothetical protein